MQLYCQTSSISGGLYPAVPLSAGTGLSRNAALSLATVLYHVTSHALSLSVATLLYRATPHALSLSVALSRNISRTVTVSSSITQPLTHCHSQYL